MQITAMNDMKLYTILVKKIASQKIEWFKVNFNMLYNEMTCTT